MSYTATNGITVSDEDALKLADLNPQQWRDLQPRWAEYYGPAYRDRVAAYAEIRRNLSGGPQKMTPAQAPVPVAAGATQKTSDGLVFYSRMAFNAHRRHLKLGLPPSVGTRKDGTPKAHCFGCHVEAKYRANHGL